MKCAHCGSPLVVEAAKAFADCEYCGKSTRVRGAKTLMAEQKPANPPRPSPRYSPPSHSSYSSARGTPAKASSGLSGCMFVFVLGFGLISAVLPMVMSSGFDFSSLPLPFFQQDPPPPSPLFILADAEPHRLEGVADGQESANEVANLTCAGYLRAVPDLRIQTLSPGVVHIDVAGTGDLTLAVRLSDGRWACDDDSGSALLPRIVESFPIGEHQIYVGRFSTAAPEPFALTVSEDMPALPRAEEALEDKPEEVTPPRRHRRRSSSMRRHASMSERPASRMSDTPTQNEPPPIVGALPTAPTPQPSPTATRGMLSVNTSPWSTVRIGGRIVGNTPRTNLIVPVGTVRVEVQREGHGPWVTLNVEVHPGRPARVDHRF